MLYFSGTSEVAGVSHWNVKEQKAYGICISLYEQHPVNGRMSGKNQSSRLTEFTGLHDLRPMQGNILLVFRYTYFIN